MFSSADPDFFLMHGDVHGILAIPPGEHVPAAEPNVAAALFERLHRSRLVSIGVVDGAARGGGAEFLAALDLRYGSERAVLGQPEVAMGILPGAGGTARLPHLLGRGRALERDPHAAATSAPTRRCASAGSTPCTRVPSSTGVVRGLAPRIASMPPASVAAVKQVVDRSLASFADGLVAETDAFGALDRGRAAHRAHAALPRRRRSDARGRDDRLGRALRRDGRG